MHFDLGLMETLAAGRQPALTAFMLFWTSFGDVQGYVLVFSLLYMAIDKSLALRFGAVALIAMNLNHVLKELIQNPRPFVEAGAYLETWAVSAEEAHALAREFSTPSGHAMAAAAAYGYLAERVGGPHAAAAALLIVAAIGASRPYLGVHYVEDVVLGWVLGGGVALLALLHGDAAMNWIARRPLLARAALCLAFSAAIWALTASLSGWAIARMPQAFVAELGFLTGLMMAWPLEQAAVRMRPESGAVAAKALRVMIAVALVAGTLLALDRVLALFAEQGSWLAQALRYLRYVGAAMIGVAVAPLVCVKLGLARTEAR